MKRYSSKEPVIFLWFMGPYVFVMNLLVLGNGIFSSLKDFGLSFFISLFYFAVIYGLFGFVANIIKRRFPEDNQLFTRIGSLLPLFYVMNILAIQGLYLAYEKTNWVSCEPQRQMMWWAIGFGCLCSTIITFINEAAIGWEKWKFSITETNRLQNAYKKSRLLCLKRQINPHFLFNCFNTLSSLISEDEEKAEEFLNEMTRVYRYLLKSDGEQLVDLDEELRFLRSYLYLNDIRFGTALKVNINVDEASRQKNLPPLSLQAILENIIYRNAFSKSNPMLIDIYTDEKERLVIKNTVQPKSQAGGATDYEEALDNLVHKYRLLNMPEVGIHETSGYREITLPLTEKQEAAI